YATATCNCCTLSLHDALPIFRCSTLLRCVHSRKICTASIGCSSIETGGVTWSSARLLAYRASPSPSTASKRPTIVWKSVTSASRSEEHTSELQSRENLVCRLL